MLIIFAFLHEDTIIGECVATINCTLGNVSVSASTIFHCHFGCKLKSISSASYIVLHLNVLIHPYTYTHFSLNEDTFNSTRDTQKAINPRPQWLCPPSYTFFYFFSFFFRNNILSSDLSQLFSIMIRAI